MRKIATLFLLLLLTVTAAGQGSSMRQNSNSMNSSGGSSSRSGGSSSQNEESSRNKQIPKGWHVWTVDERFGDIQPQPIDTITHLFNNTIYTAGVYGDYNTTGNLGGPRLNRIFIDRYVNDDQFIFVQPYDYFMRRPGSFLFTNTYSPLTNLTYNFCGNRINGEDHFKAKYSVNVNKRLGFGFNIDYLYGRGYYDSQSTSLLNGSLYGTYVGEQYQAHAIYSINKQKVTENGGITDDLFITNPESFSDNYSSTEIPTVLSSNWNRNSNSHLFLTHRYSVGFYRKVKMTEEEIEAKKFAMQSKKENEALKKSEEEGEDLNDNRRGKRKKDEEQTFAGRPEGAKVVEAPAPKDSTAILSDSLLAVGDSILNDSLLNDRMTVDIATADSLAKAKKATEEEEEWMKNEFVPVTSFIHTAQLDNYNRIYQSRRYPTGYFANEYYGDDYKIDDLVFDETKQFRLRNTFAISMLEGFNKWAKMGIKGFATSDMRKYTLPDDKGQPSTYNDHNLSIGGQLVKTQGNTFHYNATAETWLLGDDQGQVKIDGTADLTFPLFGDTVTLQASGFFHNSRPAYYLRHYHSRHFRWDDDLSMMTHTRLQGMLTLEKTRSKIRVALDELTNYTYLAGTYEVKQNVGRINNNVHVRQSDEAITLLTAQLSQDFTFGPLNWENIITYQKSTRQEALPVPALNVYTNLFLKFRIAKVLHTELGVDARFFTEYEAPEYATALGQFVVQENAEKVKIGNYPIANVYANFNLKGTRFFIMYTHITNGMTNRKAFLTPHYPINPTVLRFGISWNFFN